MRVNAPFARWLLPLNPCGVYFMHYAETENSSEAYYPKSRSEILRIIFYNNPY